MQFSEDDGDVSGDLLLDNVEIFDGRHTSDVDMFLLTVEKLCLSA